jgi:hypothetical protein
MVSRVRLGKSGEKNLDKKALGSQWAMTFLHLIWQIRVKTGVFSTGTEMGDFTGFFCTGEW